MSQITSSYDNIMFKKFNNFEEAATSILKLMSELVPVNTLFIAKNDRCVNEIVKVVNRNHFLLEEGSSLPFEETFCKLSVDRGCKILIIPDLSKNLLTKDLNVTKNLGGGCFIGIPIYYENGENYGTICGLDKKPFDFKEEHIELFQTMASLLTYVLELDNANKQIQSLSAPLVPITKGIAVLPIIGNISEYRSESIIQVALSKSQHLSLDYLVIDLSGIISIDESVSAHLLKIVKVLRLIGVTPILTGIRPDLASKAVEINADLKEAVIRANLEQALSYIGFTLKKRDFD